MAIPTIFMISQQPGIYEIQGLRSGLHRLEAYKCQVFTSFREVDEWHQYANLTGYLNGRGVPDMDVAMKEVFLQPIHQAYRELVNSSFFRWIKSNRILEAGATEAKAQSVGAFTQLLQEAHDKMTRLLDEINRSTNSTGDVPSVAGLIQQNLIAILSLPSFQDQHPVLHSRKYRRR
jgi:hypothetical protein